MPPWLTHKMVKVVLVLLLAYWLFESTTSATDIPVPGVDGYEVMIERLGQPLNVAPTPDGHNYNYDGFTVNISGDDLSTVKTVAYLRPGIFKDSNGVDVNMSLRELYSHLHDFEEFRNPAYHYIADYQRWIIYWIENERVVKLVKTRPNGFMRLSK